VADLNANPFLRDFKEEHNLTWNTNTIIVLLNIATGPVKRHPIMSPTVPVHDVYVPCNLVHVFQESI
jgi:hypothetical protein